MARLSKSNRQKAIAGTSRADRKRPRNPGKRLSRSPAPPAYLSEGASAEWRGLAPLAHKLGTLTGSDLRAFALLAETLATERAARAQVEIEGFTVGTESGGVKANPIFGILERSRAQAARLLAEFALTPKSRGQIDPAPEPNPDWDDL